ncbi:protein GRAVITROPIC IN THE LIGHT 1 [Malania oleifera]|uniref:protein GRAVITROPIC IN THE LIGHT 1 n=1 Tax=Malania oleifera TaxID=397392 RepID=UPI0025AE2926|nr:protein GRAVITROPIC IN THE LIGHT 1 [Malania oleifera]
MFSGILVFPFLRDSSRKKKKKCEQKRLEETETNNVHHRNCIAYNRDRPEGPPKFSLKSENIIGADFHRNEGIKATKREMSNRVSSFSDLIQRVAASCLLHPLAADRCEPGEIPRKTAGESDEECDDEEEFEGEREKEQGFRVLGEVETVMGEVFEAVSAMKRAYVSLQEAHCPWDPEKVRAADAAVVTELGRLGILRERFRRTVGRGGGGSGRRVGAATLREVVAPYEAAVEELKKEVKAREVEVENLREKLSMSGVTSGAAGGGRKGRGQSKRRVSCSQGQVAPSPAPDLFEPTMNQVKQASKAFTVLLLSLMRSAHWDIAAAVRSIEAAASNGAVTAPVIVTGAGDGAHHAKYALESYLCRKIFQGFDHETFYMDGSLSSLLSPDQFRQDCFAQYRDMRAMDPAELLGILPTCHFGKFCAKKYLAIVHPKMEESLFGDLEQHRHIIAGNHPRTEFYGEFLGLAKAVWLLHLLAFSLDPTPSHFEASRGAEFHPQYMESVVRFPGGRVPGDRVIGFPVTPGFKLGNGWVIKARVYLVPRT